MAPSGGFEPPHTAPEAVVNGEKALALRIDSENNYIGRSRLRSARRVGGPAL